MPCLFVPPCLLGSRRNSGRSKLETWSMNLRPADSCLLFITLLATLTSIQSSSRSKRRAAVFLARPHFRRQNRVTRLSFSLSVALHRLIGTFFALLCLVSLGKEAVVIQCHDDSRPTELLSASPRGQLCVLASRLGSRFRFFPTVSSSSQVFTVYSLAAASVENKNQLESGSLAAESKENEQEEEDKTRVIRKKSHR